MNRESYAKNYSTGHARNGSPVQVPDDVQRVTEHTPCTFCGVRAGLPCRHRRLAA